MSESDVFLRRLDSAEFETSDSDDCPDRGVGSKAKVRTEGETCAAQRGVRRIVSRQQSGGVTHHLFGTAAAVRSTRARWDSGQDRNEGCISCRDTTNQEGRRQPEARTVWDLRRQPCPAGLTCIRDQRMTACWRWCATRNMTETRYRSLGEGERMSFSHSGRCVVGSGPHSARVGGRGRESQITLLVWAQVSGRACRWLGL